MTRALRLGDRVYWKSTGPNSGPLGTVVELERPAGSVLVSWDDDATPERHAYEQVGLLAGWDQLIKDTVPDIEWHEVPEIPKWIWDTYGDEISDIAADMTAQLARQRHQPVCAEHGTADCMADGHLALWDTQGNVTYRCNPPQTAREPDLEHPLVSDVYQHLGSYTLKIDPEAWARRPRWEQIAEQGLVDQAWRHLEQTIEDTDALAPPELDELNTIALALDGTQLFRHRYGHGGTFWTQFDDRRDYSNARGTADGRPIHYHGDWTGDYRQLIGGQLWTRAGHARWTPPLA